MSRSKCICIELKLYTAYTALYKNSTGFQDILTRSFHYLMNSQRFKGTVVNQTLPSINGESLEISRSATLMIN